MPLRIYLKGILFSEHSKYKFFYFFLQLVFFFNLALGYLYLKRILLVVLS